MSQHRVSGYGKRISGDEEVVVPYPVGHVVVLASPTPKRVGEAVEQLEVLPADGRHATEYRGVRQPAGRKEV